MVTVSEAIKKVDEFTKERYNPDRCIECGDMYIFSRKDNRYTLPIYVNKNTGAVGAFNPASLRIPPDVMRSAKEIKLS